MSVDNLPSGRERAIETLIDMEPHGPFYRAARVLEESVPQALLHRPNLVTKSALVEQAYALAQYEIDQLIKYDEVFGERRNASFSDDMLISVGEMKKERILRHHAKILAAKRGKSKFSGVAPSPQLVAALRHVYGENESLELWSLLQSVMDHSAFSKEDVANKTSTSTAAEEIRNSGAYQLEALIANLSKNEQGAAKLHGLLITVLSVVASYEVKGDSNNTSESSPEEQPDPSGPPPLQVGSIFSVVRPEEADSSNSNPWGLDVELLTYLGEAAALYEERIEIQKERLLSKLDDSTRQQRLDSSTPVLEQSTPKSPVVVGRDEDGGTMTLSPSVVDTPVLSTPQPASTPDAIAVREDLSNVQNEIEAAAAALSTAIFEQIISSAATGEESSDDGESSESGSDHDDSDYDELEQQVIGDGSSSSSSSSSSSEVDAGEDGQQANPHGESEDDDEEEDAEEEAADEGGDIEDDMVLRQALALSLAEQSPSLRVDTASSDLDAEISPLLFPGPVTPGTETPISKKDSSEPNEDSPLPAIPPPPKLYPYSHLLDNAMIDTDQVETDSPYFDPAALNRFGTLPAPHVLMHLLRFTMETIERHKFQGREESAVGDRNDVSRSTIAGGMGSSLFPPNHQFLKSQRPSQDTGNEIAVSLQMLVSLFLLINDRRRDAIDKLQIAVARESKAMEAEDDESKQRDKDGSTPTEGDDPALAMALHYLDEEAESKETLEAKGMRRKAAAAAHDAAALLKSLRRRTASWKHQVELFSNCTNLSMKCLHTFLQYVVRRWLQERQSVSSTGCHDLLPKTVISKLSTALESLVMSAGKGADPTVVGAADVASEETFLSLKLYQCAVLLWGEAVPIMYPTASSQTDVLRSLLEKCSNFTKAAPYGSFDKLASLPSSESESHFHKLHVMCRRLRVSDLLDCFVSSPACYLPEQEEGTGLDRNQGSSPANRVPQRSSSLIALMGSLSKDLGGISGELQSLYLAICHKCHVRILLWDGLYACSDSETEDAALSLTPSPADSVRVGTSPSDSLVFDATKCSDSMSIVPNQTDGGANGSAVNQRASKVWGTVLSSSSFSPKTGIHRWAIRLDKCERGHVFIGVSTTQASTRTYVGGDKYGWGMIGTQALWHDRRKIRGDYGATFRTGSTIVVTLDSDAGTLSFSSWKDNASSNSFSLDPAVQNHGSPRRQAHAGGTVEDWGIAFEGLPLDSRLFPAVGLYQRDDRVTLLTVESGQVAVHRETAIDLSGGLCYYPRVIDSSEQGSNAQLSSVQKFNDLLSWDGIEYADRTLKDIVRSFQEGIDETLYSTLLPCIASALCLVPPTIPVLSQRCALALLPTLTECVLELEKLQSGIVNQRVFPNGMYQGKWVIRATGSSGSSTDSEEYLVDITSTTDDDGFVIGFEGNGVGTTGKSKNGLVAIFGSVMGSSIHFVEEWSDANDEGFSALTPEDSSSSCVISARLSLDGKKFEGYYRNVQFGTTGQIAGLLHADDRKISKFRLKEPPVSAKEGSSLSDIIATGKVLLCLAHSHLASMLAEDASADFSYPLITPPREMELTKLAWQSHHSDLQSCLALSILSCSSVGSDEASLVSHMGSIRDLYEPPVRSPTESSGDYHSLVSETFLRRYILSQRDGLSDVSFDMRIKNAVAEADERICTMVGGVGSLAILSQSEYNDARRSLICAFIHHCGIGETSLGLECEVSAEVKDIWTGAQMIMESGVRSAIATRAADSSARDRARELCLLYDAVASFLLSLEIRQENALTVDAAIADVLELLRAVKLKGDVEVLNEEMERSTKRGILRFISMHESVSLLKEYAQNECPAVVEALATGFPRVLGRGFASLFVARERQSELSDGSCLGAHYRSNLPGASGIVGVALQENLHTLWTTLCETFELSASRGIVPSERDPIMADSMILALIASFTSVMQREDAAFVILRTRLLALVTSIFESHRERAMSYSSTTDGLLTGSSIVKELRETGRREVSRSVIRSAMGLTHVLTYQSLTLFNDDSLLHDELSMCLDFVLRELTKTAPLVQKAFMDTAESYHRRLGDSQWENWLEETTKVEPPKTPRERLKRVPRQAGLSGVNYLQENGISHLTLSQVTTQKPQPRSRGSQQSASSKSGTETASKQNNFFGHQLFTHWLHILVAASKTQVGRNFVSTNPEWMDTLFSMVGLHDEARKPQLSGISSGSIPARYKARILRILFPFLELRRPSSSFASSLFRLAGSASLFASNNLDEDESVVSREAVSLLRQLHSPNLKEWRSTLNDTISSVLKTSLGADGIFAFKLGVILFFNGGVEGINRGTFVLLKPAAASALSAEQQATPSSKGHSGSTGGGPAVNSTPHHIVGNGTEGIVSGLCREDASAGVVSSIDTKNGLCEVILLNRDTGELSEDNQTPSSTFRKKVASSVSKGTGSSRHTLTVRAVRSPLADIAHAQEIALYLDESVGDAEVFSEVLREALEIRSRFFSDTSKTTLEKKNHVDLAAVRSDLMEASYSAMVLKSAISVLSDNRILDAFLKNESSHVVLSEVLRLAYSEQPISSSKEEIALASSNSFLSELSTYEARWVHMTSLHRGLIMRVEAIEKASGTNWEDRFQEYKRWVDPVGVPLILGPVGRERLDGHTTPLVDSGAVQEAPPVPTVGTRNDGVGNGGGESRNAETAARSISQSTATNDNSEDEDDSEAAATAAAHLREAAIAQMAELGLPRSWSELALRRTGGTNIEAAVHFCLERGGEMERLLAEERERERIMQRQSAAGSSGRRRGNRIESSSHLMRQLMEMGFPSRWCTEALAATGNNVDEALTWILTNGERLSAEDAGMEDGEDDEDIEGDDDDDEDDDDDDSQEDEDSDEALAVQAQDKQAPVETSETEAVAASDSDQKEKAQEMQAWQGSVIPLRFISGRSIIDPATLSISGLPTGGFSSVGTKGILLTSGKWYYEAILETAGCLQIGWADGSFAGHCHADRGDGCGDGPSSWAYDGWRRYRWHATATEWGCRWREGDVIGCMVDMDEKSVSFTLNGRGEEVGMGIAFSGQGFRPCGGVYACVSFNRREKLRMILGGSGSEPFKYNPPPGYLGVGEAVLRAVKEREVLISKEKILQSHRPTEKAPEKTKPTPEKRFLCDFSDGEHGHELMAWAHRYYGSDASVHLGSGRSKPGSIHKNAGSSSAIQDISIAQCLNRRLEKARIQTTELAAEVVIHEDKDSLLADVKKGYLEVASIVREQTLGECFSLSSLYARKLLLHVMITKGEEFDPRVCLSSDSARLQSAVRFWKMIEMSASLRSVGWVGEAGAMAVAAEALGLGISSNDNLSSRHPSSLRSWSGSLSDLDDGVSVQGAGIVQVLSSISEATFEGKAIATSCSFVAGAEAAIGGDGGGGVLVFLRKGLQGAICRSNDIRDVIIASLRRSIRLLAVVEYDGEDSSLSDDPVEDDAPGSLNPPSKPSTSVSEDSTESIPLPDARLVSYVTGLLLSPQVESAVKEHDEIKTALFEAWSVGLLSASLPWRMVCAFTASGILNSCPQALANVTNLYPTLSCFYGRLMSTVARRVWAERAASPICSRYTQAMIELLCSVKRSVDTLELPDHFMQYWNSITVDAATPLPLPEQLISTDDKSQGGWEAEAGWVSSDTGYEIWSGTVTVLPVEWNTPSRSAVRTLMDGGDGPPMLREGCCVMRGLDWATGNSNGNEDGKDIYEKEKAKRDVEKQAAEAKEDEKDTNAQESSGVSDANEDATASATKPDPAPATELEPAEEPSQTEKQEDGKAKKGKKKKKIPSPKLPLGTVLAIEPWDGIPGMARRVRWHLSGEEAIYRYGGDGGRYDISHVEVNEKSTRVRKRHPLPESAEQCAARHGFGIEKQYSVLLRLKKIGSKREVEGGQVEYVRQGILEWPDFGAGILVDCTLYRSGAFIVKERELVYGSKDSGWEARFGQASFVPGTVVALNPLESSKTTNQAEVDSKSPYTSMYQELLGRSTYDVPDLRNREDGGKLHVTSELRLLRGRGYSEGLLPPPSSLSTQSPLPPPISFDRDYHAPSLSLSKDGRTVSCVSSDGRGTAFASMGFTKGVHYWEVKLEQADIGSVFIGVAEKPTGNGSGSSYGHDAPPRLNRWHGWGFVNFRATYTAGAERIYGAHCHAGDTVGVLLDCDAGRLSFFFDGLKYGEHILNDLGCAFENLSPFGFNVDGCGSGGAGQGAPSAVEGGRSGRFPAQGAVRPKALWPVIGLRNQGDRVTLSSKWNSSYGTDGVFLVKNALALDEVMDAYGGLNRRIKTETGQSFPDWFVTEAFSEYRRWKSGSWCRSATRGSGPFELASCALNVDLDCSPLSCASACALLGLKTTLLPGDRVRLKRSAGRILELAEEAVILGAYQGRLYYRIVSQKSEGGSLTEGGGRAWCWDESEVVDGIVTIGDPRALGVELPLMDRFRCTSRGGLKVVYEGGAVVRSDLEIFEGSMNLGSIPVNAIIPRKDVVERRVNSCGVVRYRVRYENLEGWISSRIRGGKEEAIVAPIVDNSVENNDTDDVSFETPLECALKWYEAYQNKASPSITFQGDGEEDVESFSKLLTEGVIPGLPLARSDAFISRSIGMICDHCDGGNPLDVPFDQLSSAISFGVASKYGQTLAEAHGSASINQVAATAFSMLDSPLPSVEAILARVALLRAFNRRAKIALPWLSSRPSQEGSALFGGVYGHGASIERAGRSSNEALRSQWVQVPTVASKIRGLRGLIFTSTKKDFLRSITDATTTPTPLSHDEYELPREIRTVRLNRLKARRVMSGDDAGPQRKHSVFAQLHNETKSWGGAALRRGFVAKGHGGQKRAFKVKLIGEGVNDYSGPYREAFTDSLAEILSVDAKGIGSLGVLDKTPNGVAQIGENRGLFMFSLNACDVSKTYKSKRPITQEERDLRDSFSSVTIARDETSREVEEALVFLGRVTGTAFRHGIPLDLPLPLESVWKAIVEEPSDWSTRLQELDVLAHRHDTSGDGPSALILWQQRMLNAFVEGLSNVLPVEVLSLLSGEEFRDIICGNPDVDVDLLRRVVEYEGYEDSDEVVQFFWDTLRELTNDERKTFLQFVWARNRLPMKESDFEAPFKIMKDSAKNNGDEALPSASTCFFSLSLPEYSSKALLKEKLLFAINNVTTMETDFQTNSAEIAEGYRAF